MSDEPNEFRPLRLRGGRFDQASTDGAEVGFPLEALAELVRYERLVIQVARGLWIDAHPTRRRVPKRFEDELRLRLTAIERGSVAPVMERQHTSGDALFDDPDRWMEQSQHNIAETIEAIAARQPLPDAFPVSATQTLVQLGSGLRDDEAFLFRKRDGAYVTYTQEARGHLRTIVSAEDITIDGELIGRISAFDAEGQGFDFSDRGGKVVRGSFGHRGLLLPVKEVTNRKADAPFVRLDCSYTTDHEGRLARIEDVANVETVVSPADPLGQRLRQLLELEAGWRDGEGLAPAVVAVEWARDFAAELTEDRLVDLRLFPTSEGGVLVEQQVAGRRWTLEIDSDGDALVIHTAPDASPLMSEPADVSEAAADYEEFFK